MLTVFGTIALDTTRTPHTTIERILGGAATFAALSARYYISTSIVGIVGNDFPPDYRELLDERLNTLGITRKLDSKSFHYDSSFDYDLSHRTTNKTELNVISGYEPQIPEKYVDSDYVYLANNDPAQNIKMMDLFSGPKLIVCDTIDFWILSKKNSVLEMISRANGVIINEQEAKLLYNENNLLKCGRNLLSMGPVFAVIKKGENGAILFHEKEIYPFPAFPTELIMDPTGAGDSFAGAFVGYLAKNKKIGIRSLKKAVAHGNVMGSFAIEDFGVTRLVNIKKKEILGRYSSYARLLRL
ncbi:MAG: PfkB family carbohydrate kinase [Thermoproteota archaeon]|nr:PfkB family carbohydrate kinase [Thermoproteota archaeon]